MFHQPPVRMPSLGTQFVILLSVLLILLLLIVLFVFPPPLNG
jgi:hypothetical protein